LGVFRSPFVADLAGYKSFLPGFGGCHRVIAHRDPRHSHLAIDMLCILGHMILSGLYETLLEPDSRSWMTSVANMILVQVVGLLDEPRYDSDYIRASRLVLLSQHLWQRHDVLVGFKLASGYIDLSVMKGNKFYDLR
jgi:hypothetical protein